jgi:hypothetical protein
MASVPGLELLIVAGQPALIDDAVVWDWRFRYMHGEFDLTVRDVPVGALVRIIEGEFADALCRVTKVSNGRVAVVPDGQRSEIVTRIRNVTAA